MSENTTQPAPLCAKCGKELSLSETTFLLDSDDENVEERVCEECSQSVQDEYHEQTTDINYIGAILGGLVGAAIGVAVWYLVAIMFDLTIGIIAIGVGFLVAQGAMFASGNKRGMSLQIISLLITAAALFIAEYLVGVYFINQFFTELLGSSPEFVWIPIGEFIELMVLGMREEFDFIAVVIWGIGLYTAFVTPKAKKLTAK
ncbi:MAG: hypothetical protein FWE29_06925 [Defluviitaleaceae bacterium]|nr:hypothetical protein [Defluviitaleaceae bacterium]